MLHNNGNIQNDVEGWTLIPHQQLTVTEFPFDLRNEIAPPPFFPTYSDHAKHF